MGRSIEERRREPRFRPGEDPAWTVRIRPGPDLAIVDVSPAGALIEGARPLPPGGTIVLRLQRGDEHGPTTTARVIRCDVSRLRAAAVTYRSALRFEGRCSWVRESATHAEYQLPGPAASPATDDGNLVPVATAAGTAVMSHAVKS
jgi:hypothetical protein